ncbi:MAG TPA: FxSxx-COOH system tetratricopeptide repeat protein [Ktedonobacteraceae bacterium]|nr:FxSxx-COOH system tetratricopeptide repeat protein [Ktedonobacteraceae bacterium]
MHKTTRARLSEARRQRGWSQQQVADSLGTTRPNVSRWEAGLTTPGPYFRAKLCELFGQSAHDLELLETKSSRPMSEKLVAGEANMRPSPEDAPALWNVPFARNPLFTGREELLQWLDHAFSRTADTAATPLRRAALTQPQALKGLGGIGKTQIAVEYAYRACAQGRYVHVFWINAASEEAILSSFVALAEMIPAIAQETDQHRRVSAIKRWLEQCPYSWLLIFDNADEMALLPPYLPQHGNGSLLFTTRMHAVGSFATPLDVETMGLVEGTMLLLQRSQHLHASDDEHNEATNIVIALDGFPLALDQAGAYIEETGCSFQDYLQLYQQHHQALLARRGKQATNYPDSVATTWSLSFRKIAESNPAAAELLHVCAFLSPDAIPEELLIEGATQWPAILRQAVADRLTFDHLLEALLRFSLIKRRAQERLISLHRLVQLVQREMLSPEEQRHWVQRVVQSVHRIFPANPKEEVTTWPHCLRYLEQVQACDALIEQYRLLQPEAAELLGRAGMYLNEQASYPLAEALYVRALRIWETREERANPQMALVCHGLAKLYQNQGKYAQAEPLYQRAIALREHLGGSDHVDLASPLTGLANLYFDQKNYEQAERLYQRAISIREQHLGPDHPLVSVPLNNLADLYREQGRYPQAEALFLRALHLRERQADVEHPNLAHPLNNLAHLYREQGRYGEAEPLYQHALRIWEQHLGPEHPLVAHTLNGLATMYGEQGRYGEAEPLFQRALRIREQYLGPAHPQVAHTLDGLATLYREQGRYEEAEPIYQRALRIWEQVGPDHAPIAYPLSGLATLYREQGQYEEAEPLFQRALRIREQYLGPEHPETAETIYDLARLWEARGSNEEVSVWYARALAIREWALGRCHPKTMETRARIINLLRARGQHEEAAKLERMQTES